MDTQWFYFLADGTSQGPYSHSELQDMIQQGQLPPSTLACPAGEEPRTVTRVEVVVAAALLPEWIDDVRDMKILGPQPTPALTTGGIPEWLDDVARQDALDSQRREDAAEMTPAAVSRTSSLANPNLTMPTDSSGNSSQPLLPQTPASATPVLPPAAPPLIVGPTKVRPKSLAAQSKTDSPPVASTTDPTSLAESFRVAQSRLSEWLDEEINKPHILHGTRNTLEKQPGIQSILQLLTPYGSPAMEHFWKFALYLLENRRRYYLAGGQ